MTSAELVERLLRENTLIPILICAGIVTIVVVKTAASCIASVARERTRREIAAYIAEGSMSPEQGERLIRAESSGCTRT